MPAKYAAEAQGVSERTYYEWLHKGAEGIYPYHDFSSAAARWPKRSLTSPLVRLPAVQVRRRQCGCWSAVSGPTTGITRSSGAPPRQRSYRDSGRPSRGGLDPFVPRGAAFGSQGDCRGGR